jgi:HK97 family phage prohead protease
MKKLFYKSLETITKDIDDKTRAVTNVFNKTNVVDSDSDLITPDAFDKTISERGPQGKNLIYHLTDHNPSMKSVVGKFSTLSMQDTDLVGRTIIPNTTWGNDVFEMYKSGVINQHSIGFSVLKAEKKKASLLPLVDSSDDEDNAYNDDGDEANEFRGDAYNDDDDESNPYVNVIREVKLFEGSAVLWGANESTPNLSVGKSFKSLTTDQAFEVFKKLQKELEVLGTFLYKGKMSDETGALLQFRMIQVQDQLDKLFSKFFTQPVSPTVAPKGKEDEAIDGEILKQILLFNQKIANL